MYKVQFHFSKKRVQQEDHTEAATPGMPSQKYRQIKEHFSDDEGDRGEFDHTLDDLDCFLDEDAVDDMIELEMSLARRMSSTGISSPPNVQDDSTTPDPQYTII